MMIFNESMCDNCDLGWKIEQLENEIKEDNKLRCFLDGNALCIVKKDFVNLQESDAVFIELGKDIIDKIKNL